MVIVDMWLQACVFDIVSPQHTHNHMKNHVKMVRNISDEIDLDKELKVFLLDGSKSDVWEYLASLPQVENAQNLYPNLSFTIMIVFTVVKVSIKYRDTCSSKFHYRPALNIQDSELICLIEWFRTSAGKPLWLKSLSVASKVQNQCN